MALLVAMFAWSMLVASVVSALTGHLEMTRITLPIACVWAALAFALVCRKPRP